MLTSGLDALKRQAASNNGQDVELRALEREAKAQRDLLESYLAKYREASARDSLGAAPGDARIISRAVVSNTPYFPKKLPIVLIATLATLLLTAGFITTGELLAGNVYRAGGVVIELTDDRQGYFAAGADPSHAIVHQAAAHPAVALPVAETVHEPEPPSDVTVGDVALAVLEAGEAGKRIAVIGAEREVAAAATAIGLARALAREARVVLVDLAFDEPALSAVAADPGAPGMGDLVRGAATFGQIITRDRYSRVQLVLAGEAAGNAAAIINSERLTIAMRCARAHLRSCRDRCGRRPPSYPLSGWRGSRPARCWLRRESRRPTPRRCATIWRTRASAMSRCSPALRRSWTCAAGRGLTPGYAFLRYPCGSSPPG